MNLTDKPRSKVIIENLDVFLDLHDRGFSVINGVLFDTDDGDLTFRFGHSLISDYTEDD